MSFDQAGQWGLRFRLRLAIDNGYTYVTLAALLGVSAEILAAYLTDPAYVLSEEDYAAILASLSDVSPERAWWDTTRMPNGVRIHYAESPLWTIEELAALEAPEGATAFKVHYLAPSDQHRPMSTRMYMLDTFDPVDIAIDACDGDLTRLIAIIFYEYREP